MRKRVSMACSGLVMMVCGILAVSNVQAQEAKQIIQVKGADSMAIRMGMLSKLFVNANPGVQVNVEKGGTVEGGIAALINKEADIAMTSRRITDKEDQMALKKEVQLVERLVGYGGIVFVIHPSNPVDDLTVDQVRKILKGEIESWGEVGGAKQPIYVIMVGENHPGTSAFLRNELMGKAPLTSKAEVIPTFPDIMRKVAATPSSIGPVRVREAFELPVSSDAKVKVLKIRQSRSTAPVMPSRATVAGGMYPIRRPYYLYTTTDAGDEVVKFVDFAVEKGWGSEG